MKIVQISSADVAGGAEKVASSLHQYYKAQGFESYLLVGQCIAEKDGIKRLNNDGCRNPVFRTLNKLLSAFETSQFALKGFGRLIRFFLLVSEPLRSIKKLFGIEDFDFPGIKSLDAFLEDADIIHCHNLHGNYFDLRVLPNLTRRNIVLLHVHDFWLFTGHCALPMECPKWTQGCGDCPDLNRYPSISRDATSYNWKRKRNILNQCGVYLTTPSQWLMDRACESYLASNITSSRVINNGYDTNQFYPQDKQNLLNEMNLEGEPLVIVTAGFNLNSSEWKNYSLLYQSVSCLAKENPDLIGVFFTIGGAGDDKKINNFEFRYVPYVSQPRTLAKYFGVADIYLHGSRVESFGNVLMEAKACKTAIVAPAVGGIPEHVLSLKWGGLPTHIQGFSEQEAHGLLYESGDLKSLCSALTKLANNRILLENMCDNAEKNAKMKYSIEKQGNELIEWYRELLSQKSSAR